MTQVYSHDQFELSRRSSKEHRTDLPIQRNQAPAILAFQQIPDFFASFAIIPDRSPSIEHINRMGVATILLTDCSSMSQVGNLRGMLIALTNETATLEFENLSSEGSDAYTGISFNVSATYPGGWRVKTDLNPQQSFLADPSIPGKAYELLTPGAIAFAASVLDLVKTESISRSLPLKSWNWCIFTDPEDSNKELVLEVKVLAEPDQALDLWDKVGEIIDEKKRRLSAPLGEQLNRHFSLQVLWV